MPSLIHLAIPAFIALVILEAIVDAFMRRDLYDRQDTFASLTMGIGNVLVNLVAKAMVFGIYTFIYQFRFFDIPYAAWSWVLLFIVEDFTYYLFHRTSHECRLFWAAHVVHHSSQRYNLSTALRQTWTGSFYAFIFWLWLPLIGFPPLMVLTMQALSLIYQFWIHTEIVRSLGPLEWILNTPSHHRVHHASNGRYLDRNHAGSLIIWDRLFGSFEQERERTVYGLTHNIHSYNPLRIAFHEYQAMLHDVRHAPNWRARFMYIFGPPGWRHDGTGKTSRELRAAAAISSAATPSQ
jgi:sterol desaturase/sphingolipid hydroxylase (fatty acid hydroxylase superfamily)